MPYDQPAGAPLPQVSSLANTRRLALAGVGRPRTADGQRNAGLGVVKVVRRGGLRAGPRWDQAVSQWRLAC